MKFNWHEEKLTKQHNRHNFDCGNDELNGFLKKYARQSQDKYTAKTYVAIDNHTQKIIGFYTVTLTSLDVSSIPPEFSKGLGYHEIPLFVLARLAVDLSCQGQGLGGQLLIAAAQRCFAVAEQVGGIGFLIHAKDEAAAQWYRLFGAQSLPDTPLNLILPFKQILVN